MVHRSNKRTSFPTTSLTIFLFVTQVLLVFPCAIAFQLLTSHGVENSIIRRETYAFNKETSESLRKQRHLFAQTTNYFTEREIFLESLEEDRKLNVATPERTNLLDKMISNKLLVSYDELGQGNDSSSPLSIENPGLSDSFQVVAPGTWKVIYAPHMTTMAKLGGGYFDVQYVLNADGTMTSHAAYDFPIVGRGYLSVSGTYASVDNNVCRVNFDEAWVKILNNDHDDEPYQKIGDVPDGLVKELITRAGRMLFFEQVSVFPISFLDDQLIVFDFELFGTRICAKKI